MTAADFEEKLADVWRGDTLNRKKDAEILRIFTVGHLDLRERAGEPRTYVLNLDANWGAGKTFFLTRFKKHLALYGFASVYINAWENDHSNDPFVTVIDAIQSELKSVAGEIQGANLALEKTATLRKSTARVIGAAAISGGKHFITRYIGDEAVGELRSVFSSSGDSADGSHDEFSDAVTEAMRKSIESGVDAAGEEILSQFRDQRDVRDNFRVQLADLCDEVLSQSEIKSPVFVLIDELDRCRPSYAIELLEQVKHLFSINNFVFVLATDTKQLSSAIQGVYGSEFDGSQYLKRFIDRSYLFQETSRSDLVRFFIERNGLHEVKFEIFKDMDQFDFLSKCFDDTKVAARDIFQMIELLGTFVAVWQGEDRKIDLVSLLPIIWKKHFGLSDRKLADSSSGEVLFQFVSRGSQGREAVEKKYSVIWEQIDHQSLSNFSQREPRSSFEQWIANKNINELASMNYLQRQESIRHEYTRLLEQLSNITGAES